jgi:hypothetical protein
MWKKDDTTHLCAEYITASFTGTLRRLFALCVQYNVQLSEAGDFQTA